MHDTFLNERIYEALVKICKQNGIYSLNEVGIVVNTDSHVSDNSIRESFREKNINLIGDWTKITIERQEVGKLNAIIKSIEGESLNG